MCVPVVKTLSNPFLKIIFIVEYELSEIFKQASMLSKVTEFL